MVSKLFALIGTLVGGFLGIIIQRLLDYFYLQAPHLGQEVTIISKGANPPHNNFRDCFFEITINIFNTSKNEAYAFEILSFEPSYDFTFEQPGIGFQRAQVTAQTPFLLKIGLSANLKVSEENANSARETLLNELNKEYKIKFKYFNALGKLYTKQHSGVFKPLLNSRKIISGW